MLLRSSGWCSREARGPSADGTKNNTCSCPQVGLSAVFEEAGMEGRDDTRCGRIPVPVVVVVDIGEVGHGFLVQFPLSGR